MIELGRAPWADDIEAWLEVGNAEEIADDIERYTLAEVERAVARERERCARLAEGFDPENSAQGSFEVLADLIRKG